MNSHHSLFFSVAAVACACLGPALGACSDDGASGAGGDDSTSASEATAAGTGGGATGSGAAGSDGGATGTGAGAGSTGTGNPQPTPVCTEPTDVPCSDQVILQMNLKKDPAPGAITSTPDGQGWISSIDATAGGAFAADPHSYTYGRFTDAGLEKVAIGDEDALDSMDWDIAFRRYVVRINSGNSGPSCVRAARLPGTPDFDSVTGAPDNVELRADEYFTESCELIPDGSGLPSSPATALSSFWTYPGCVQMTDHVFVLELANGRRVKLQVSSYYAPATQEKCDADGKIPQGDTSSANYIVRWAFLP